MANYSLRFLAVLAPLALIWSPGPASARDEALTNPIGMKLVPIPAGTFQMGSPEAEDGRKPGEVQHSVTISDSFYMGVYEVTQSQYEQIMGTNPSGNVGADLPVDHVTWFDAVAFCGALTTMDPKFTYRLPTEAEWEYACRAGSTTRYYWGDDPKIEGIDAYAYYKENADGKTHPVGGKRPNPWGLFDMNGNVWEWCLDWMGPYPDGDATDPRGPDAGEQKVCRGGCWAYDATRCRSAERNEAPADSVHPNLGIRVVATPKP